MARHAHKHSSSSTTNAAKAVYRKWGGWIESLWLRVCGIVACTNLQHPRSISHPRTGLSFLPRTCGGGALCQAFFAAQPILLDLMAAEAPAAAAAATTDKPEGMAEATETTVPSTPPVSHEEGAAEEEEEGWETVGSSKDKKPKEESKPASPSSSAAPPSAPTTTTTEHNEQDDDDSDDESSGGKDDDGVQLGFVETIPPELQGKLLFQDPDWDEWDGGKVGGKPIWLNPRDLPSRALLDCASCQGPLSFILQIYCPLDEPAEAFHRVLYVFACRKPRCYGKGCAKVLRCQLPRKNAFYAYDVGGSGKSRKAALKEAREGREGLAAKTCEVCGQGADKVCAGCKGVSYCTRAHQREGWKAGHRHVCKGTGKEKEEAEKQCQEGEGGADATTTNGAAAAAAAATAAAAAAAAGEGAAAAEAVAPAAQGDLLAPPLLSSSVFPEFEIVIEEEKQEGGEGGEEGKEDDGDAALLKKYQDVVVTEMDDDARVGQKHLDEATGANSALKDRQSLRFLAVIGREPGQILRYARWNDKAPLWVSAEDQPSIENDVPACERCGGRRAFEFQVMPQLLHYLGVDSQAVFPSKPGEGFRLGAMDWGTLAVYTCVKSCGSGGEGGGEGRYVEEFVWRQKPMA